MNRNSILIVAVCLMLLLLMNYLAQRIYPPIPVPVTTNAPAVASNIFPAGTNIPAGPAPAASTGGTFVLKKEIPEELLVITNTDARYTFTSRGGGLQKVELVGYPETVGARRTKDHPSDEFVVLNAPSGPPALAILGDASLQDDGVFKLTQITNGVRAEKTLSNGLAIIKEFRLDTNYLVSVTVRLENQGRQPLVLPAQEWVVGTATPLDEDDKGMYLGTMWYDGSKSHACPVSYFSTNTSVLGFSRTPKTEYQADNTNVVWAAVHNQFFALMAMPKEPVRQMTARAVFLPQYPDLEDKPGAPLPQGVQTDLVYPEQTLAAGAAVERKMLLFAGPKKYRMLARIGGELHNDADLVMNFGTGFYSFWGVGSFFAKFLLTGLDWLHDVTGFGFGWGIVIITVLLRGIFWPFTAASLRSSRRMQALAPEMKALREKYKDDPQKQQAKTWELYKKHHVNPFGGCLPSLVQMPVFFGFLSMIRCAIELRGTPFLWVADLSKPDQLFVIPGLTFVPFISTPAGLPFNLLPLLMVSVMVWQAHLQPPSPGMDPAQQKMMRYMPLIFLIFLYNYSSGMALYMTVSTLASVLQSKLSKSVVPAAAAAPAPVLTPAQKKKK